MLKVDILLFIVEEFKLKLIDYLFIIVYLLFKWCGYVFKFFFDVLREKSYFLVNCVKSLENCFFV